MQSINPNPGEQAMTQTDPRIHALAKYLRCPSEQVKQNPRIKGTFTFGGREYAVLTDKEDWALSSTLSEAYTALGDDWECIYEVGAYAAKVATLPSVKALLLAAVANRRAGFVSSDEASTRVKVGRTAYHVRPLEAAEA